MDLFGMHMELSSDYYPLLNHIAEILLGIMLGAACVQVLSLRKRMKAQENLFMQWSTQAANAVNGIGAASEALLESNKKILERLNNLEAKKWKPTPIKPPRRR